MRILLLGAGGQVGRHLSEVLSAEHKVNAVARTQLDIAQPDAVVSSMLWFAPHLMINCAAYTAVDQAEEEAEAAFEINADAPAYLAGACRKAGIPLIHFSTDYVFNGDARRPYTEDDATDPRSVYGKSKLQGERGVAESGCDYLILRTSWVYSHLGKNFYRTMLRLAEERTELRVVADQCGAPTYAGSIAAAVAEIIRQLPEREDWAKLSGVYHFSCGGETSWHGFASELLRLNGRDAVTVQPIPTSDYPTPAARPAYSVLDNAKLARALGVELPNWEAALRDCVADAAGASPG